MSSNITLLDGGLGQELIRRAKAEPTPLWSVQVMLDQPELVEDLHIDFIEAGAEVISLNNYSATPERLTRDASIELFEPVHRMAIELAHNARRKTGKPVKIAGCLPPMVASYKPELAPDFEKCLESYRKVVEVQENGVDLFLCETISSLREARAAVTAGIESGLPVSIGFSLDDDNPMVLRSGETLKDAVETVRPLGVEAIMINCSAPETVDKALPSLVSSFPKVGAYANGFVSIAPLDAGGTVAGLKARKDLDPKTYADYAMGWVDMGAQTIGGCCEVGPAHIAEIHRRLDKP